MQSVALVTIFLAGPAQAIGAFSKMIPSSPAEGFTPVVLSRSLEAPVGIQLLSVSMLLLVFAVLATEQDEQSKADEKPQVKLLREDVIAFRLGIMTCLGGLIKIIPASPSDGLNPIAATVEASEGIQLLSLAVLLLVFAVAVCHADLAAKESEETEEKPQVHLVKADAIAFRSGIFACLLGLASMRAAFTGFSPTMTSVEMPEGVQFLMASVLLLVFAVLILDSKEDEHEEKPQVELVRAEAIAFRFGIVAGLYGLSQVLTAVRAAVVQAMLEGQEGYLLLAASASLLLLAAALHSISNSTAVEEKQLEDLKLKGHTHVQLIRPETVAIRGAVMAGLTGLLKITGSAEIPGIAISGEILVVGVSAAAVAVCHRGL